MAQASSVEIEQMQALIPHYQNALDMVNTAYTRMQQQRENLGVSLQSTAGVTFGQALDAWLADFRKVQSSLSTILEHFSQVTGNYVNLNETISVTANTVAGQLSQMEGLSF